MNSKDERVNMIEPKEQITYCCPYETIQAIQDKLKLTDDEVWKIWELGWDQFQILKQQAVRKRSQQR